MDVHIDDGNPLGVAVRLASVAVILVRRHGGVSHTFTEHM